METKKKKTVTLPELIEENGGPSEFGRRFGFDRTSAHQWATMKNVPTLKKMVLIFEKSKGRCTYQKMIETFVKGE